MKKFILIFVCIVMLFSFAACGQIQNKESKAFDKLKNIIIENGTKTEDGDLTEYTYTYSDDEFKYTYHSENKGRITYTTINEVGSVVLLFPENNDRIFSGLSIIADESFNISSLCFEGEDRAKYNSSTKLELFDYYDKYNYVSDSSKKEAEDFIFSLIGRFSSVINDFDITMTDLGFTSIEQ